MTVELLRLEAVALPVGFDVFVSEEAFVVEAFAADAVETAAGTFVVVPVAVGDVFVVAVVVAATAAVVMLK
jgi:hypothetical protein